MQIQLYPYGIYRVLRISDLTVISQLEELRLLIEGYIARDDVHIAVCFTDTSYLYSKAVAVLVSCVKKIKDAKGDLCILEPKLEMTDLFHQMGIDEVITAYSSESDLPDTFAS